jgi:hypothetical protein
LAISVALPATASASTQVGETFLPSDNPFCGQGFMRFQPEYVVPFDGVLTSFSFQARPEYPANPPYASVGPWATLKLKVGRAVAGNELQVVGSSKVGSPPGPNALAHFPTRIPVRQGDVLGAYSATDGPCSRAQPGFTMLFAQGDLMPFSTATFTAAAEQLDVAAALERDADADEFGDESQDKCLARAGPRNGCPPPPARCMGKAPTIIGTNGVDDIVGTAGRDVVSARHGKDTVSGLLGNDLICGGAGADRLLGGKGADALLGGENADRLLGGGGDDRLFGGTPGGPAGKATDTCAGQGGADRRQNCQRGSS